MRDGRVRYRGRNDGVDRPPGTRFACGALPVVEVRLPQFALLVVELPELAPKCECASGRVEMRGTNVICEVMLGIADQRLHEGVRRLELVPLGDFLFFRGSHGADEGLP